MSAPADPMSSLLEAAVSMHEMFLVYTEAGFTEDQALRLVAYTLAGMTPRPDDL